MRLYARAWVEGEVEGGGMARVIGMTRTEQGCCVVGVCGSYRCADRGGESTMW